MVMVALLYSMTSSLGKIAVTHSSPVFFGATYYGAIVVCLFPLAVRHVDRSQVAALLRRNAVPALLPGLFYAGMALTHFYAVSLASVSYVIAIKRSSLLIGSAYGFLFFGERNMKERLAGAGLMFAGFLVIVLSG